MSTCRILQSLIISAVFHPLNKSSPYAMIAHSTQWILLRLLLYLLHQRSVTIGSLDFHVAGKTNYPFLLYCTQLKSASFFNNNLCPLSYVVFIISTQSPDILKPELPLHGKENKKSKGNSEAVQLSDDCIGKNWIALL